MAKGKCCKTIEEALIFATSTIKFFERMHAVAHKTVFFLGLHGYVCSYIILCMYYLWFVWSIMLISSIFSLMGNIRKGGD